MSTPAPLDGPSPTASAAPHRPYEGLDGTGSDMGRLLSLSDGVFAFALTFLVVSLVLPSPGTTTLPSLPVLLRRLLPGFVGYALSFLIISTWWTTHHRLFSPIVRYDSVLVRLNNLFLLVIAITPFLVALLLDYGPGKGTSVESTQLAVLLYSGVQALGGLDLLVIWRHSTRQRRLVEPDLPEEWVRGTERSQLGVVAVFLAAMPVVFLSPIVAELVWVAMLGIRPRHLRPHPARTLPRSGDDSDDARPR